jgi:hypothetical protein
MTAIPEPTRSDERTASGLLLPGLNGANPLGFLAALGTLQILSGADPRRKVALSWREYRLGLRPAVHGISGEIPEIARQLAESLRCPFTADPANERERESAQIAFDRARKAVKDAEEAIKKAGLKGKERTAEWERRVSPLRARAEELREPWLAALVKCVPSAELALGLHLNATCGELREASQRALQESTVLARRTADLYAAFGSDACAAKTGSQMKSTPFCFITGSGHQYFLDTIRQLMIKLDSGRFESALAAQSEPADERLSMRWDPVEDRRYALMADDPTAANNVSKTSWALNALAYRGLALFPSVPTASGLRTTGWSAGREPVFTWPIWSPPLPRDMVASLLAHCPFAGNPAELDAVSARGVAAVYQSTRIQVGNPPLHKINFTPARRIA